MKKLMVVLYTFLSFGYALQAVEVAPGTGVVAPAAQETVIASRLGSPKKSAPVIQIEEAKSLVQDTKNQFCFANLSQFGGITALVFPKQDVCINFLGGRGMTTKIVNLADQVVDQNASQYRDLVKPAGEVIGFIVTWAMLSTMVKAKTLNPFNMTCIPKDEYVSHLKLRKEQNSLQYKNLGFPNNPEDIDKIFVAYVTSKSYYDVVGGLSDVLKFIAGDEVDLNSVSALTADKEKNAGVLDYSDNPDAIQNGYSIQDLKNELLARRAEWEKVRTKGELPSLPKVEE